MEVRSLHAECRDLVQVMQQHVRREAIQDRDRQLESNEKAQRARLQAWISLLLLLLFAGAILLTAVDVCTRQALEAVEGSLLTHLRCTILSMKPVSCSTASKF